MSVIRGRGLEMTMRDGSHDKYWQVVLAGLTVATRYGRIGSAGQVTVHQLSNTAQAMNKFYDLVQSKDRKGYRETPGTRTDFTIPEVLTTSAQSTSDGTGRGGSIKAAAHALMAYYLQTASQQRALMSADPLTRALSSGQMTARRLALGAFAGYTATDTELTTMDEDTLATLGGLAVLGSGLSLADV